LTDRAFDQGLSGPVPRSRLAVKTELRKCSMRIGFRAAGK